MAKKVLVVEDDGAVAELVAMVLRDEGYDVVWADDYQLVLNSVVENDPDLVLIDSPDPRGFGPAWDLAQSLHQMNETIPLIMFTGHVRDAWEVGVTERGKVFVGAITKPFDIDTLLLAVESISNVQGESLLDRVPEAC
ncbi:MAG: response regulator [Chloroflexi bacterium]|nr:response regulator [Chloroflexota bacterium]